MADRIISISDLSGGRNGIDPPGSPEFPDNQCADAVNVDWLTGGVARRRNGSSDITSNTTNDAFTTPIVALIRHTPTGDENASEVWALEEALPGQFQPLPAGTTAWRSAPGTAISHYDAAEIKRTVGTSFNGKLYLAYRNSVAVDRMQVYDAVMDDIRYTGLGTPAAPTVANTGAGAYAATLRYYRVRYYSLDPNGAIQRMSEPSASTSFTPSGAGTAARVTKPAALNEGETYWLLEASPDNVNFYRLSAQVVGTTTVDDSGTVSAYSSLQLSEVSGWFSQIPSCRYVITDGNRLIFANFIEQGYGSRVGWTPVLGTDDGDTERIFQTAKIKPYAGLDEKNGGDITGLGQINGTIYVFKQKQTWRGMPTEDLSRPYIWRRVSGVVGCVRHQSIALGEDAMNNPALYFMSEMGPYRIGINGLEYLGRDIEDLTRTDKGKPNINTNAEVPAHSVFHSGNGQWWLWFAVYGGTAPSVLCVLDVRRATRKDAYGVRGGWTRFTGGIASAYCSCMGHVALGAFSSLTKPWAGIDNVNSSIKLCDDDAVFADSGTGFSAYVRTKSLVPLGKKIRIAEPTAVMKHLEAVSTTIECGIIKDFVTEASSSSVVLAASEADTGVVKKFESVQIADAAVIQLQIGQTTTPTDDTWRIEQVVVPIYIGGDL